MPSCTRKCRCWRWFLFPIIIIGIRAITKEKYGNRKLTLLHHTKHQHNTNTAAVILLYIMWLWCFLPLGLSHSHFHTTNICIRNQQEENLTRTLHITSFSTKPLLKWVNKDKHWDTHTFAKRKWKKERIMKLELPHYQASCIWEYCNWNIGRLRSRL